LIDQRIQLKQTQRTAVEQTWSAATAVLEAGAQSAGLVLIGELLRAVHSCRVAGLPRLSAAGLRVAQQMRDLHAQRPEFRLGSLTWDLQDLLTTAHALRSGDASDSVWIGSARRSYIEVGSLQLIGLFTEPVVTPGGFGGVVTYLADQSGVIWSLGSIAPGGAERCQWAYVTPVDLGEDSPEHRGLCRGGLSLEHATAAANRRLGTGQRVVAVPLDGCAWSEPPLARLFDTPVSVQLDRAWAAREATAEDRRAGDDLLFVKGRVGGAYRNALELHVGSRMLRGIAPSAHAELAYRRNLGLLAATPGLSVMLIGRISYGQPRTLRLLAVGNAPGAESLRLSEELHGRVNLGLDSLPLADARPASLARPTLSDEVFDPLDPFRRRLQQLLLGGTSTLSPHTWSGFARDEAVLSRSHMPTAASLLHRLREPPPFDLDPAARRTHLAQAWLAAQTYATAAESSLQRSNWLT
jgi:hypothetical protein